MDRHYGNLVERVIRRNGYSISELARLAKVNRRSIYNWFTQKKLKPEIIFRIGCALKHDFSEEFPELFTPEDFQKALNAPKMPEPEIFHTVEPGEQNSSSYWKNKYISALEELKELLQHQVKSSNNSYKSNMK